ncbi:MAG TPA: AAA family ATPase [Thermohalobaculum sp.]|nr:AAA family ATPase [Thermohalobaculum sp.]
MLEYAPASPDFSADQAAAWEAITARMARHGVEVEAGTTTPKTEHSGPGEVIAVTGKAGSGKTMLLARLAARLAEVGLAAVTGDYEPKRRTKRSFAVLAPTNKAASVLRNHKVPATTIHRIVYTPVYDPEYQKVADWLEDERKTRPEVEGMTEAALDRAEQFYKQHGSVPGALAAAGVRGADFITGWTRRDDPLDIALVDEASMIDAAQLEDLKEIFGLIVLFGDPAQLAPVGSRGEMIFETLPEGRRSDLARIHRQAAGNPILDLAHALGDPDLSFEAFEDQVRAAADHRVLIASRADAELMCGSPILVWRNKTRIRLIKAFRTAHHIPDDQLVSGEPLICDGLELPLKQRKQRIDLEARGLIKGAQATYLGPGRKPGFVKVDIAGTDESGISVASIIQIERPDDEEPLLLSAARSGAVFLHGAACTIHKAQGSQWPRVQVFAPDLYAAARSGQVEAGLPLWKRLAYVAITRAEEQLVWVTRYMISRPDDPLGGPGELLPADQ